DLGLQFSPLVKGELTVHIDANPVVTYKSSAYVQELVGLVVGQGFKALIKPESWAASHAADHVVRSRGRLRVGWPSDEALAGKASWGGSTPRPPSIGASSNGRTAGFESADEGSNPSAAANRETRELSGLMAANELIPPGPAVRVASRRDRRRAFRARVL